MILQISDCKEKASRHVSDLLGICSPHRNVLRFELRNTWKGRDALHHGSEQAMLSMFEFKDERSVCEMDTAVLG